MNWNAATHINKLTKTSYFVLCKLYSVSHYLGLNTRVVFVKNLLLSRLGYRNLNLFEKLIQKLPRIQNAGAILCVSGTSADLINYSTS